MLLLLAIFPLSSFPLSSFPLSSFPLLLSSSFLSSSSLLSHLSPSLSKSDKTNCSLHVLLEESRILFNVAVIERMLKRDLTFCDLISVHLINVQSSLNIVSLLSLSLSPSLPSFQSPLTLPFPTFPLTTNRNLTDCTFNRIPDTQRLSSASLLPRLIFFPPRVSHIT